MVLLCHYVVHFLCTLLHCGIDVLQQRVPVSNNCCKGSASAIAMRGTMPLACQLELCVVVLHTHAQVDLHCSSYLIQELSTVEVQNHNGVRCNAMNNMVAE